MEEIKPIEPENFQQALFSMELGEIITTGHHVVARVPGGWTWSLLWGEAPRVSAFVPLSKEFNPNLASGAFMVPGL